MTGPHGSEGAGAQQWAPATREAELHLLAGRLQGAKRAAAERGELRFPLPVGYVYDDEGATVMDPDAEVAAAVTDLFAAFRAGGSAYQVVAAFKGRRFPLRAYGGVCAGQLRWGRLTPSREPGMFANPAYAGPYLFGRYHSRRIVEPDRLDGADQDRGAASRRV